MIRFIVRRTAQALVVVLIATLLIFIALFQLGDPFASTGEKTVPPEVQAALREKFGMDRSVVMQYITYVGNLLTGDLGIDFKQRREVSELLLEALPPTIRLTVCAIVIDVSIGVLAGVIAAVWRYSFADVLVTLLGTLAIGVPTFVIGISLRAGVSGEWIFPMVPRPYTEIAPWYREVILPAVTLAIVDMAFIARLMRGSMLEVLRADYIRTARAKGLKESLVIGKHALRNSIIPVVTYVGIGIGVLLGGAVITESIFQYRGVGYLLVTAITDNNKPIIMAVVTFGVLVYVLLSLLVDVLYAFLDPRIRLG